MKRKLFVLAGCMLFLLAIAYGVDSAYRSKCADIKQALNAVRNNEDFDSVMWDIDVRNMQEWFCTMIVLACLGVPATICIVVRVGRVET